MPLFTVTAPSLQMPFKMKGVLTRPRLGLVLQGRWMYRQCTVQIELLVTQLRRPVIEVLNGGLKAKMHQSGVRCGFCGAISNIHVKFSDGQKADFGSYQAIALDEGDEFQIRAPTAGCRYWRFVVVSTCSPVLNSASFDSLAILGPEPLKMGIRFIKDRLKFQISVLPKLRS